MNEKDEIFSKESDHLTSQKNNRDDLNEDAPTKPVRKLVALSLSIMAIHITYSANMIYAIPLLLKCGLPEKAKSYVWPWSPLLTIICTPILGPLSDSCTLSLGRRRPFIIGLGLLMALSALTLSQFPNLLSYLDSNFAMNEAQRAGNTTEGLAEFNGEMFSRSLKPVLMAVLLTAVTLADFACDSCQAPSRAYILDVVPTTDHQRAMSVVGLCVGIGGTLGYLWGVIDFHETALGRFLGGQEETVFLICCICVLCLMTIAVCQERETPLKPSSEDSAKCRGLWKNYVRYALSILQMPKRLKILCFESILLWLCVHSCTLFVSDFAGQVVFEGNPNAGTTSKDLRNYDRGVRFGSLAMATMTLTIAITAPLLQKVLGFVNCRGVLIVSCVLVGVCYLLCLIWPSRPLLLLLSVAVGLTCMCVIVIPTLLLARYHSENNTHHLLQTDDDDTKEKRGLGTDAQVLWATLPASQFTIFMVRGFFDYVTGNYPGSPMILGLTATVCATISTFFVDFADL